MRRRMYQEIFGSMYSMMLTMRDNFKDIYKSQKDHRGWQRFRYYCSQCGCHCHEGLGTEKELPIIHTGSNR